MNNFIVAAVTTNKTATAPPAVTIFAVRAASDRDAERLVNTQVVAPQWALESRDLGDQANALGLADNQVRQL